MKILVPTDFSEPARAGLAEAIAWAKSCDGRILLLHVASLSHWPLIEDEDIEDSEVLSLLEDLQRSADERLKVMCADVPEGVPTETFVVQGTPSLEVARFAREKGVHLVVVATHGHSRLKRFFLGSTADRITRSVPCPILLVRDDRRPETRPVRGIAGLRRILVATDFSESSADALSKAVALARPAGAEILLMHVVREADHATRAVLSQEIWADTVRRSKTRLARMQKLYLGDGIESRILVAEGVPSAQIADTAAENDVDLIVLGAHGRSGLGAFLLGSTAERVLRVAPCSVYVEKAMAEDTSPASEGLS